jgi:exodeoxyribonuclease VII small subunit
MAEKEIVNMEFEDALEELEVIVRSFENRNIRLKEAISAFDRGKVLYEHCTEKLKEAENRLRVYENGEFVPEENS